MNSIVSYFITFRPLLLIIILVSSVQSVNAKPTIEFWGELAQLHSNDRDISFTISNETLLDKFRIKGLHSGKNTYWISLSGNRSGIYQAREIKITYASGANGSYAKIELRITEGTIEVNKAKGVVMIKLIVISSNKGPIAFECNGEYEIPKKT
jgi:hypothetical protein